MRPRDPDFGSGRIAFWDLSTDLRQSRSLNALVDIVPLAHLHADDSKILWREFEKVLS
jgi:hypothetical protein